MKPQPAGRRPWQLVAASSLWMATVLNWPLWRELRDLHLLDQPGGWALMAALALVIAGVLAALLSLLASRWTLKPAVLALLASAALGAYFMHAYRIVIDPGMLQNVAQTDRREAAGLFSPWLLAAFAFGAGVPGWLAWRSRVAYAAWPRQGARNLATAALALVAVALVVLAAFQPIAATMRNHKQLRYLMNPLNSLYAVAWAAGEPWRRPAQRVALGLDAQAAPVAARPPLLVLVLGETARSGNFGLNGYARDTTPRLAAEGVASWRNVRSCGTSTAASLPCMFSHLGREGFDARASDYENLLDVAQHAGLAVLWIDNQAGCKGVCDRVPHVSVAQSDDPVHCAGGECHDGILLQGLDARLAALPPERRARGVLLVLHQMGSHGPAYARRSPPAAKRFAPECTSVNLQECSAEGLRNAYDNSIVATDQVLADTIAWLKRQQGAYDPALVYLSDHGESLGENNLYLHGLPYAIAPDVQKRVPWITWLAAGFQRRSGIGMDCVRGLAEAPLSHDNLFHATLGLLQVRTAAYQRRLDPYAACQAH